MGIRLFDGLRPRGLRGALRDALAGMTLASMNVPQVLGYTRIAGTPVVTRLYTVFLPLIAFAIFGSSRHPVVAADSATASIFTSGLTDIAKPETAHYMDLVEVVALLTAGLLLLARIFRLGFLADFLSRTVLVGFLTGVGFQVGNATPGGMPGIAVGSPHTTEQLWQVAEHLPETHLPTLGLAALVVTLILVAHALARRLPTALSLLVGTIWASYAYDFAGPGIATPGPVPSGLPGMALPSVGWHAILALIPIAASCFVIIIAQSAVTAGGFALRRHEWVDEDADIPGLSAANAAAALSGAFVVDAEAVTDLDFSAARALRDLGDELKGHGTAMIFGRVSPDLRADMERHGILDAVGADCAFPTLHQALTVARDTVPRPTTGEA